MKKNMVLSLQNIKIKGNILDIAREKMSIIYSYTKEIENEISVDYVEKENNKILKKRKYDSSTFFFVLNKLSRTKKEKIIKDVYTYLDEEGEIYIWDILKEVGMIYNNKISVILPNDTIKEANISNYNLFIANRYEEIKKIVEKYYIIKETKLWEEMFYIKAIKISQDEKGNKKNENIANSN